ncbi:poly(A)-binding protein binding protein [Coemansia biformis]|uniref:Poly(A)-binding protein binding protein n=1 Tax=Coemansia biformis TaxID=1286918 RepID=A0A9W8CWC1_9FUNG|nr:poly(A)-binding protein binding protein [Coemansia biformis]
MSLIARLPLRACPPLRACRGTLIIQRGLRKKCKIPVTLLTDVPHVGPAGAVVQVNRAHMRHELFPKRLADYVIAFKGPLDRSTRAAEEAAAAAASSSAQIDVQQRTHAMALRNQDVIGRIVALGPLVVARKVVPSEAGAEEGAQAIYGSLTKADVARELAEKHGIAIDKDALGMEDKIKSTGDYACTVKLQYAGQASLKVRVVPAAEEPSPRGPSAAVPAAPPAAGGRSFGGASSVGNGAGAGAATGKARGGTQGKGQPSPLHESIEGEAPGQVEAMHTRLLFLLAYLVGTQVTVTTTGGDVYLGVLCSINPNDAQSVVLRYACLQHGSKTAQPIDTLVINGRDCLCIAGTAAFSEDSGSGAPRAGFKTDTDISRSGGQAAARELHRWVPDEDDSLGGLEGGGLDDTTNRSWDQLVANEKLPGLGTGFDGEAHATNRSWDQFAANERLFGLTTDFDEEIYTTKLDRTRADFKDREREAIRIAQEIQSTPFLNSHVAEERHDLATDDGSAMDEEDKYGAVLRPSGAPGKYVPPYLRGKANPASAGRQQASDGSQQVSDNRQKVSDSRQGNSEPPAPPLEAPVGGGLASSAPEAPPEAPPQPNNAMAAAALAKLNIRTSGHSPAPGAGDAPKPAGRTSPQRPVAAAGSAGAHGLAADPAITATSKPPGGAANTKLASLRGNRHRTDVAALNKPMADITEKLNSERERIQQHKQELLKNRMSELVKFHKSFKLNTPMPDDVAEIVGAKKKGATPQPSADAPAPPLPASATAAPKPNAAKNGGSRTQSPPAPLATGARQTSAAGAAAKAGRAATPPGRETPAPKQEPTDSGGGGGGGKQQKKKASPGTEADAKADAAPGAAGKTRKDSPEPAKEAKKSAFKFNAKASTFKPSVSASAFVPKLSASSSRASSAAGTGEYNAFFGRRMLKKAPLPLWGGAFKLPEGRADGDDAPTWPFGSRTYQSQFVVDGPEAIMYPPQGYMPSYGYGYYQHYQYPPQMAMGLPGPASRHPASSPYAGPAAVYGGASGGAVYASGPYTSVPGFQSPVITGDGRSPVIAAIGGSAASPLPHGQHAAATPELGPAMLPGQGVQPQQALPPHVTHSGSDSPGAMYGSPPGPPLHMGMVPPPMSFGGMHAGGYMGPSGPPHQGYPPQSVPMPMGYAHYPPAQPYETSPPSMAMMHGSPHPEHGASGASHHHPSG